MRYDSTGASANPYVTAGSGGLVDPYGITFGPNGDLFVSSLGTGQVLEYDGATGAFLKVFVAGSAGLASPVGLAFGGPLGNLFVASNNNNEILDFDPNTGALLGTFATSASGLANPTGLVFGPNGNLYVSSENNNEILEYDPSTGNLFVATHNGVQEYNGATGAFVTTFVGIGSGGLALPTDAKFGPDGNLYVANFNDGNVLKYGGTTGAPLGVFATTGTFGDAVFVTFANVPEPATWLTAGSFLALAGLCLAKRKTA